MVVDEERMAALEARTARLEAQISRLDAQRSPRWAAADVTRLAPPANNAPPAPDDPRLRSPAPPAATDRRDSVAPPPPEVPAPRLEDLLGGRILGWVGGVAVLVGLLFFLVIAVSRGWIGEEARVLMSGSASLLLLAVGARSYERRGRSDAALSAAAAGIAGLFATAVVAGPVYGLVPVLGALGAALAVGAAATALALRWSAPGIGWLGILGALASPALVGAAGDGRGIALMLVAYAAAGAVLQWQRWHALAGVAFLFAVPQLAWWMLDWTWSGGPAAVPVIAALAAFGAVTAAGAAGPAWRARTAGLRVPAQVLLALNALALAGLGALALGATTTHVWLAALALAHLVAAVPARRSPRASRALALTLASLGIVLADIAFAAVADGLPLVLGWAAGAVACSALARNARRRADEGVALAGLGGHLLLAVATAIAGAAPLSAAAGGAPDQAAALSALAALAVGAWAAARLVAPREPVWRLALDATALLALAFLSAVALDGVALTLALAGEAVALAAIARREAGKPGSPATAGRRAAEVACPAGKPGPAATAAHPEREPGSNPARERIAAISRGADPLPFAAAVAFLGTALGHGLAVLAPPTALVAGLDPVLPAIAGFAALAIAAALVARAATRAPDRTALTGTAAVLALYLVSTALVTPFQPGGDTSGLALAALDVRQQGQALLSALWAFIGVTAVVVGLLRDARALRLGALALLGVTVGKVFVFDLASLTSMYRVGSCIALGLLLLVGAFAWQRIRPRPVPDLREVPHALR